MNQVSFYFEAIVALEDSDDFRRKQNVIQLSLNAVTRT